LSGAKFTLRPSLAFAYIGSVTARHSSSGRQPNFAAWYKEWIDSDIAVFVLKRDVKYQSTNQSTRNGITELSQRAPPIFGWAAVTLGSLYSSSSFFLAYSQWLEIECLRYFHTRLSANLECRSEMCFMQLGENTGCKITQKIAICAPSHSFVGLYLRN